MTLPTTQFGGTSGYSIQSTSHTNTILEKLDRKESLFSSALLWPTYKEWRSPIYTPGTDLIIIDFSSIQRRPEIKKETSSLPDFFVKDIHEHDLEISLARAMLKYDSIGLMPPKEKETTTIEITKISKGKPLDVEPDAF